MYPLPSLPVGGSPLQIQFTLNTIQPFDFLYPYAMAMEQAAQKSGLFIIINSGLSYDKPQIHLEIDRDKAAQMGVNMSNIGSALSSALGGNNVNQFNMEGRSYDVIPQVSSGIPL